jgi:hypothetical protein
LPLVEATFVPSEAAAPELLPPPAVDATAPPKDPLLPLLLRLELDEEDPLDPLLEEDPEFD